VHPAADCARHLVWEVPVMKGLTRLAIIVLTVVLVTGCATWPA
jgi:hypothetical protein